MSYMDNRSILQKADMVLSDLTTGGGLLAPAQAKKFMRLLTKESSLLGQVTFEPMGGPKKEINQIRFGGRVLHAGSSGQELAAGDRSKPDLSKVELDAQLFKGEVHIPDKVFEDNIERGELRQTIMELLGKAVSRDLEEVVINGDTTSADPFLAQLDGILAQAQSNVVDAAAGPVTKALFNDLLKALPPRYRKNKRELRHYLAADGELDYRDTLAERATAMGDRFIETDVPVFASGVPVVGVPLFPDDLGVGNDQTNIILTHPKNIHVGVWRQIRVESARDISKGVLKIVVTLRADVKYAEEPGVAKAINVQLQ